MKPQLLLCALLQISLIGRSDSENQTETTPTPTDTTGSPSFTSSTDNENQMETTPAPTDTTGSPSFTSSTDSENQMGTTPTPTDTTGSLSFTSSTEPEVVRNLNVTNFTTSSVSLIWTAPVGQMSVVQWSSDGERGGNKTTNATSITITGLSAGVKYDITVQTTGGPLSVQQYTKPEVVRNLTVSDFTTSFISLMWAEAVGRFFFIVHLANGNETESYTVTETHINMTNLTAGVQYEITVTAVAGDNSTQGESTTISQYTRPEKPVGIKITARGTSYLYISWSLPKGNAEHYEVNISNDALTYMSSNKTITTTAIFTNLYPGRIFNITVSTVAGNFLESSAKSFATVPTHPGSIIINQRTNSSLHLQWSTPALMEGAPHISYIITYQFEGGEVQNTIAPVNNTELSQLVSGTSYNISVQTVGPEDLKSMAVYNSSFTLPNPVLNLLASPKSTTSVEVHWSYPDGAPKHYNYSVQTDSQTGVHFNTLVSSNNTDIPNLEPGTRYNITVTTIAAPGTKSTEERTFSYTMPKAVTNLRVEDVNTTAIRLTWQNQSDHKPSYSYLVEALLDDMVVQNASTETEAYTFFNLSPGQLYIFAVFTIVGGVRSTRETSKNYTMPEVVSDIFAIGSITSMSVSWTLADGQVVSYTVLLYKGNQQVDSKINLTNSTANTIFVGLKPGVLYCVVVVTKSGPLENNSSRVCNATFPNPPGSIMVVSQTVKSISFTWPFPEDMDRNQYNFSVSTSNGSFLTESNWFLLDGLQSGSPYSITVVTVGVLAYKSTAVTASNYTRPYPVSMLTQTEITTNSVTLVWEQQENKSEYTYEVQTSSGPLETASGTTKTITGLLSGSNYTFTVTTMTADGTEAAPVTVSYFTRPNSIRDLEAKTLNTTAVNLTWMKPLEYKLEYTYLVQTTRCSSQNQSFTQEAAQISGLSPGTECTFCVIVKAVNGIEGQANCTFQYTKPEAVQPIVTNEGSNSSILVSWTKPPGGVESYKVYLNSSPSAVVLNSTKTFWLFGSLSAGRLYTAVVFTYSGPFNASSEFITNATFPNPPGLIEILTKATSSIGIRWEEAPLMTSASFYYHVTAVPHWGVKKNAIVYNTNYTFNSLLSGTSYNISVATVGPMHFESEEVQIHMVTTRPLSVNSLMAATQAKTITVTWTLPNDYKESYRYNLSWEVSDKSLNPPNSTITGDNKYDIENLLPGTRYNFSVTTETSDGTKGAPIWNTTCTNASPVNSAQCQGPNTTDAQLILMWTNPEGNHSSFQVTVKKDNNTIHRMNTASPAYHAVSNLSHYTNYELSVTTLSCGLPSTPVLLNCRTGITKPPIPDNYESLLMVTDKAYNKFSVQIDRDLLNNINGPITHVGVLVTNNLPATDINFTKYLKKTYAEWRAKKTQVYLATVTEIGFQLRSEERDLTIEVGNESKWMGYTNGPLDASGKYQYAIVLFTSLNLEGELVDAQNSLLSITISFSNTIELPQNPVYIGIAIGATLGIFFLLFIILIGFIIYWKRISNKEAPDIQIHSMRAKVSVAVRVEDYEAYYKKQKADSNCGFAEEFEDLKLVGTGQSKTSALTLENKPKNRYNNVLPYDSSRVKLSIIHGSPYDDYINANYMPGSNSRKEFIAAQGPLPTTVNEFWRMIWEKNVHTLVMLTRCNEQGRVKCEQYWNSSTKHFENITVTTTSEIPLDDWTIRDFDIKNVKTAETRSVRHFHFTAWPDHGVPQTTELLISFRHLVREHMDQYSRNSPTVVHCSAGVGRTGTFIAIDRLIFQIERENTVDVYGIVHDLRMHRPLMVQTEDQYVFLNQCALDIIRSRTGTNVDLIYQNAAALSIYENIEPKRGYHKNGYHNA